MKKFNLILIAACLLLVTKGANAQADTYPVLAMSVNNTPIAGMMTSDSLPVITDSTLFSSSMNVSLVDTTNISSIDVSMGSTLGGSDIVQHSFTYDVSGGLGSGLSYTRDGYNLSLGLGSFYGILSFYAEIKIHRSDGSYSDAIIYNR